MTEEKNELEAGQEVETEAAEAVDESVETAPETPEAEAEATVASEEAPEATEEFSLFSDLPDEADDEAAPEEVEDQVPGTEMDIPAEELGEIDLLAGAIEDVELADDDLHEIERRSKMRWYVIHANTGHENKVKRNIEMAIRTNHMEEHFGEVLVATQEITEMKNGKRSTVKRKFFPSYILVEMQLSKETQHFINSIPGVTRFIGGTALRPQPITRQEVDRIMGRIAAPKEAKNIMEIPYDVGDRVQVIDGPFSDWEGIINEINRDKGKLKVMISIFGKETPAELDFLQVKQV